MKSGFRTKLVVFAVGFTTVVLSTTASAKDIVLPAGTILQCTLNEPNFSTATAEIGDPVLCHLREVPEFGQQAFPRGSYLLGHLESAKEPGHFFGKGNLKLQFDRIGLPSGDLPLDAKVISTRGYRVDKEGKINGKGHARRDVIEWMLPPLWPWKVIMLPARGPRPKLKGETVLSLRLMDDVQIPQVTQTFGPGWRFFGQPQNESFRRSGNIGPSSGGRDARPTDRTLIEATGRYYTTQTLPSDETISNFPLGVTIFVLKAGTLLAVADYSFGDSRVTYDLPDGGRGVISSEQVDWSATLSLNARRGLRIVLRSGPTTAPAKLGF